MNLRPLAVSLAFAGIALAATTGAPSVRLATGFVAAVPPGSTTSAAYVTLKNTSNQAVRLTAVKTTLAGHALLMQTTHPGHEADGMIGMRKVAALVIPAKGQLVMKPDGNHVMLMDLKRVPKEGERVNVTFTFSTGTLIVSLPVRRPV
ncbi:copper chaperone PCu(A)C [Deinococcus yavapaiensis]|uniref:Copper(I)-binding protein n=1 Tax=Deinococcus yavapaiensis KR-236 TaxID=694435 RepID=A0A318S441_9DEIO|nr:copper chaperone PCu(A)C [Deinococcus yavapaiensis]PYE51139.1 hypothetical protein DES52_11571 [Deinococcus yavapaiensis KR-236]